MGAERKSHYIDSKAKLATAYHEVCLFFFKFVTLVSFTLIEHLRGDMHSLLYTQKGQCLCIKSLAYLVATHWAMYVMQDLHLPTIP
jgi:hypothetical protein